MITEYIRYTIDENSREAFEAAYARATASLRASRYCIDYTLSRSVDEPGSYILRIGWTSAQDHLSGFRGSPEFGEFFAHIKPYVDSITEMRHYDNLAAGMGRGWDPDQPTLYDWAGGSEVFQRLFRHFYDDLVAHDELIGPLFAHMSPDHPEHVAAWLGEVFGGPPAYSEHLGGYPAMVRHHVGLALTEPQRRRWVTLLTDAADDVGLPTDPEFRAAFAGYLEWGTRIALSNSAPGAKVVSQALMPRWGWGVAPPWTG